MKIATALLISVSLATAIIALLIYLKIEPFAKLPAILTSINLQTLTTQLTAFVTANWDKISAAAVGAVTIGSLVYKWWSAKAAAAKAAAAVAETQRVALANAVQAGQQNTTLQNQVTELQAKLSTYESDPSLTEAQRVISTQADQITSLRSQMSALQTEPARLVEQLWQNTGGKTVEEDGKLYRVIELVREIVK